MENVPILRHAAIYFADQHIREMATVGGNVANSSPSGDTIAPLTALEAVIHTITSKDNKICEKETPITEFITGVGKNLLEKGEVISSITCPVLKRIWMCIQESWTETFPVYFNSQFCIPC